jgi:hypothetical protein
MLQAIFVRKLMQAGRKELARMIRSHVDARAVRLVQAIVLSNRARTTAVRQCRGPPTRYAGCEGRPLGGSNDMRISQPD